MVARRNTVEIEGAALGTELARLAGVAGVLSHPEGIMDRIGRYLVASTLRRFESERAPDGTPWLKSARAVAEGGQTLTDSGRLRRSIAHVVTDGGRAVEVGSNVVYAAIHQFGGLAGKGDGRGSRRGPISASTSATAMRSRASSRVCSKGRGHDSRGAGDASRRCHGRAARGAHGGRTATPVFAAVLSALDTAALTAWPKTPAALVLPISDEAEESTTRRVENAPVQHVVRVGVSVMVAAPNDRGGARGRERLSALLARARQALAGWTPPGQREVLSFRRGRLVSLEDGRMQWLDEYEIRRVARAGVVETE